MTSLLSFIADELGEEAVERALRKTGDELAYAPARGATPDDVDWGDLPASARAKVIARAMLANMGEVEVEEDDEKIVLSFRCGSGGKLIDDGRYDEQGGAYLTLHEPAGRTFQRDELWVYCALLGEQRDPAGRVGRRADVDRVSADRAGRTLRAPHLQGRCRHARRRLPPRIGTEPPRRAVGPRGSWSNVPTRPGRTNHRWSHSVAPFVGSNR